MLFNEMLLGRFRPRRRIFVDFTKVFQRNPVFGGFSGAHGMAHFVTKFAGDEISYDEIRDFVDEINGIPSLVAQKPRELSFRLFY